jgi:hypothetical protein
MKLLIESSTHKIQYEIFCIEELELRIKQGMKALNCNNCNFELKGEAKLVRAEETCLFG